LHSSAVVHLTRAYKADVPAGPGARITQSRRVTGQPKLTRNDSLGLKTATSPVLGRQTSGIPYASATCRYPPPPDTTSPTTTVDPLDRTTPGPAVVPTVPAGQTIGYWMPSSQEEAVASPVVGQGAVHVSPQTFVVGRGFLRPHSGDRRLACAWISRHAGVGRRTVVTGHRQEEHRSRCYPSATHGHLTSPGLTGFPD
jgi:hypothetical protein